MKRIPRWLRFFSLLLGGTLYVAQKMDRKHRKISWWRVISILMFTGIFVTIAGVFAVASKYEEKYTYSTDGCAVVFGAAVWRGDRASHALSDRINAGVDLYLTDKVGCLILSGGPTKYGAHEIEVMKAQAVAGGVDPVDIREDADGVNTLSTLLNLPRNDAYVFVSNDFHLARIGLIAKRLGFDDYNLHASTYQYGRYYKEPYFFMREVAGYLLYWFFSPLMLS